ncbi:hypothetical protein TNIN_447211 [Trichonephila inaurata madagascariensis]|uniref:Uncharacterized protein n=1 Tax=Trichonephila inaurata madagascariensis TaxID=2747483 RepID=A0A8X7CLE5_9ARAC|nr:hypothetical protein TNIN_447211 [Trichonephila inaurata madagascariensis]
MTFFHLSDVNMCDASSTAHNSLLQREPEDGALDVLSPGGTKTSAAIDFCPPTCLFPEFGLRNNTGKEFRTNS